MPAKACLAVPSFWWMSDMGNNAQCTMLNAQFTNLNPQLSTLNSQLIVKRDIRDIRDIVF